MKSHRKHGKHRNFYSLTLINGGLRPWAASQLVCLAEIAENAERFSPDGENEVTQMAQITRIMLALRQEVPAVCPCKFKKIEIHKKLLLYI